MEVLFAPWRMEFIEKPKASGCVLCSIPKEETTLKNQVLAVGQLAYVLMNKFPYSNGHLMIVPLRHEKDWTKLTRAEGEEIHSLTQRALRALGKAFEPDGFNLGVNLGRAAGAGIEEHVHQHIVPRWNGDVNFMPLLSETKVIPEHLTTTLKRLREVWDQV